MRTVHQMDAIRGASEALRGRRGILCRVVEPEQFGAATRLKYPGQASAEKRSAAENHAG